MIRVTNQLGNRFVLLKRLLFLRLFLLLSSLAVIAGLNFFPGEDIRLSPLLAVLGVGAMLSLYVWRRSENYPFISDWLLAKQLLIDSCLLLVMVWFSGRSTNPFIYYLLVIIAVSASIFSARIVWAFSAGGIAIYSALLYIDFNEHLQHMTKDFQLHLFAMWLNFVGSALLISFFISRLTTALRDRERELAAAREETLNNEQLIGIGTLAASTVHSLGTPLSTIAVSLGELKEEIHNAGSLEYLDLIQSQVERCKLTMGKLSLLANNDSEVIKNFTLATLVEDIREYFLLVNANPQPEISLATALTTQNIPGSYLLKHALINLIDNAIQAASTRVNVDFESNDGLLKIVIEDDGKGIPKEIADNLGKPFASSKEEGLGIGIFLANSTIERLQGKVRYYSADANAGRIKTRVIVEIPLAQHSKARDEK